MGQILSLCVSSTALSGGGVAGGIKQHYFPGWSGHSLRHSSGESGQRFSPFDRRYVGVCFQPGGGGAPCQGVRVCIRRFGQHSSI